MASFQPPPSRYLLQAEPLTAAQREGGQKQSGGKLAIMIVLAVGRWWLEPVPTDYKKQVLLQNVCSWSLRKKFLTPLTSIT
jgi:hypothetical protein